MALRPRTALCALVLDVFRLGPTAAAPPPAAGGANLGEAGISELWRVVNGLGQTVQILQGEVQRLTSEREEILGRVQATEETNAQQGGQLAELRRTVEGDPKSLSPGHLSTATCTERHKRTC